MTKTLKSRLLQGMLISIPEIAKLPPLEQPCTHCHVVAVVFVDGSQFKFFESCEQQLPRSKVIARGVKLWCALNPGGAPVPSVYDIVRYTREVQLS